MTASVIIPARFGSTRFAAKILASDTGKPLVQHVVERAHRCRRVRQVIVATDDQRIVEALGAFGTRAVMTDAGHVSGTDRIAEVARDLADDVVVNVQGDEPEIEPETIDALIERLESSPEEQMVTAATRWPASASPGDPNLVKVVLDQKHRAIYFSRLPIPYARDRADRLEDRSTFLLHQGIYAYRRDFLLKLAATHPTPLEQTEKLEQLRALEHGHRIGVLVTERAIHGIDTPEQYQAFVQRFRESGQRSVAGGQ